MNLSFNFVDLLIVLVIIVSAAYAAWRGFMSETLSIFAWAAAAFATLYFGPWLVPLAKSLITNGLLASLAAYAAVFLGVFIPISFMSYRFSDAVKHSPIGPLDRALGIAFGVVRGLVVIAVAYLAFTYFDPVPQQPRWLTDARLLPLMQNSSEVLLSLVPLRDQQDFADRTISVPAARQTDALGSLIQRQNAQADQTPAPPAKKATKGYGAKDRRALDNLLEATGSGGNAKP